MKKRIIALLLCALVMVTSAPITPLGQLLTVEAAAADIDSLQAVFNSVPPREEWGDYMNTDSLKYVYEKAQEILASPESFNQSKIDEVTADLERYVAALKPYATGITLDSNLVLSVGKTAKINVTLEPSNAGGEITWYSADSTKVAVKDGVVSVLAYSKNPVEIIAEIEGKDSQIYRASCFVTTVNPVAGVTLSETSLELYQTQETKLKATLVGLDSTAKPNGGSYITWDSNNTKVAVVEDDGKVTAVGVGSALITVTVKNDEGIVYTAECTVKVTKLVAVQSLSVASSLVDGKLKIICGTSEILKVLVLPSDASIKALTWSTSDKDIVSLSDSDVSSGGFASVKLNAKKAGTATITYTTKDGTGISGSVTVEVLPLVSSIKLSATAKSITVDSKGEKIGATVSPSNAGNQKLKWTSSNESICKVDYNGVLYPVAPGECTIRAEATDGSDVYAECKVIVSAKAKSVKLNKTKATLNNGDTLSLYATVTTADDKTHNVVTWSSSNTKIATVDQNGKVTAKYPGEVVIKATAADGTGEFATCVVTVKQKITSITMKEAITLGVGKSTTLKPTIAPDYATETALIWSSDNSSVATVDANGVVKAGTTTGTAIITCENADGSAYATCKVTVVVLTTGIVLSSDTESLWVGDSITLKATVTPVGATDKSVTWKSSNTKVATVTSDGVVVAKAGGTCVITAENSGGQTASCYIDVSEKVSGVELSTKAKSMYVGEISSITATVLPSTATNKQVSWSSSNTSVATVSSSGEIKALKTGTATITVKTKDGGYKASCTVTVHSKVNVTGISLDRNSVTVNVGKTYQLVDMISPSNASEKSVTWSTDNKKVATVTSKGVIKGVKAGTAIITVKTVDGGYTAKCKVTVVQPVTGVKLGTSSVKLAVGKSKALTWTVSPSDATNKDVKWSSSDTSVVTVSKGVVTAKKAGSATVTVTTVDGGYKAVCNFTVYVPVTGVKVAASKLKIPKGQSRLLTASVLPSNATNKTVSWSSSNTSVAKVSSSGQITGVSKGTVNITAKTADGAYTAVCVVTVYQLVESIKLDATSVSLQVGKTKTLTAKVSPSTASYPTVKWKSSNEKVATVDSKGCIKAISAGTATIKAVSLDKNAEKTCKVTVVQPAKSVKLDKKEAVVKVGKLLALKATVSPSNATNKKVVWSSNNTKRATVSEDGVVKGISAGYVTITAKTVDGGFTAKCKVLVAKSVTGIKLDKTSITINIGKTTTITPTLSPKDATIKTVYWSSDNLDVCTVDSSGKVTAKGQGYATITAKTKDGSFKAKASVLVVKPVTGVKLNKTSAYLNIGSTMTLVAKVEPSDATIQSVTWSSSNPSVATVSSSGLVKGIKKGVAKISCMTNSGKKVATCTVSVVKSVTKVTLDRSSAILYLGDALKLESTIYPVDASVQDVSYSSSNTNVATVSSKGLVTPLNLGRTVITVKTKDGGHKATCVVTVKKAPESIKLGAKSVTLKAGQSATLKYAVYPTDATNRTATFSSSNTKIVTVDSKGVIKAVSMGTAYVIATTENGIQARCKVTVTQPVTGIEIDPTATVYTGETVTPYVSILPKTANNQGINWKSSNTAVAKVTSKGVITGIKAGTATITATSAENSKFKATCVVTVKQHVTSVSFDEREVYINKGTEADLKYNVLPADATDKKVTFESSNPKVISVTSDGRMTAHTGGSVTITIKSVDNTKATAICYVTVTEPATGVSLNITEKEVFVGDKLTLVATVSPDDAYNKLVRWSSSNAACASVDSKGVVTAKKSGTAVITATTVDGGYTAKCTLTLLQRATSIKLDSKTAKVNRGETLQLNATVLPDDCYNKAYTWTSADTSIARVNESGLVTGVAPGTVVLTCKSKENQKITATVTVTVHELVASVDISDEEVTLYTPFTKQLSAEVLPANASDKSLTWSSSDEKVATVDKNGLVTAKGKGEAIITVKSNDTGVTDSCKFIILTGVEKIVTGKDVYSFHEGTSFKLDYSTEPEVVDDPRLTFTSSNEEVFTVSEDGTVTGVCLGEAELTITSVQNPEAKKVVKINVTRAVTDISLDISEKVMYTGDSLTLLATVLPEDASDKSVKWTSSDESVVTVDSDGVVKAVSRGFAEITATTVDGGLEAICRIEVVQLPEKVDSSSDKYIVYMGKTLQLDMKVMPENANDTSLTYVSANTEIAVVDEKGLVTPVAPGTCTVTAASGKDGVEKVVEITVVQLAEEIFFPVRVRDLRVGEKLKLNAEVLPETTTDKSFEWSSSDENVATIDEDGVVVAVGCGAVTFTATSLDGSEVKASIGIKVVEDITGISVDIQEKTLEAGSELSIKAEVQPEFAYDKTVTFKSSDESVATVDENGNVKAIKKGIVVITATTADGKFKAITTITVVKYAESIQLGRTDFQLKKDARVKIEYQVLPLDTSEDKVEFVSSDEKVATVSEDGVITAVAAGEAKITATVTGTDISAVITVKVS